MRPLRRREQWLLAPVPALAIAALWWSLLRPTLAERRASLEFSRAAAGAGVSVRGLAADVENAEARVAQLTEQSAQVETRIAESRERWSRPAARAAAVQQISRLFLDQGISLLASAAEERGSSGVALAPNVVALQRRMQALGCAEPELWRFSVRGSFSDLAAALSRVAGADTFALPVALELKPAAPGAALQLTLWVWI